jgi:hypothetical protein
VEEAVAKLGQIFRANVGYNPAHGNSDGGIHPSLSRQFRGMRNNDPSKKHLKALPVCVYREIYRLSKFKTALRYDINIAWLQILAFFFCMRSWEYSDVNGERRTKTLCIGNILFHKRNKLIPNDSSDIFKATPVSLTLNGKRKIHEMIRSPIKNQIIK